VSPEAAVVVGASGALGSAITRRLAGAGLPVVAVARKGLRTGPTSPDVRRTSAPTRARPPLALDLGARKGLFQEPARTSISA
jgi:NAD(P)-dependent dehydrogenase (short-subunit alcohol dehydrogenase family)